MAVPDASRVRVRIAPSPTGFAHLGTASTALYNVLFARANNGTFVLRVDDTDLERNRPEYELVIYDALHWLGLDWDEGPDKGGPDAPYRQSERLDLYKEHAARLLASAMTYRCYCTREEHLSNTTYQLMNVDALGYPRPVASAHMPLILSKDGAKLSKRKHPETNLVLYRDEGYLPEALINYLALLGWNPGTSQEIFTFDELVPAFSFERVQHAGARFDWEKLNWINGDDIRGLDDEELAHRVEAFLPKLDEATIRRAVPALKTRLAQLKAAAERLQYLLTHPPGAQLRTHAPE